MLWTPCPDSSLAPAVAATRAAFRRWRMQRWLKRHRDRIGLIACEPHDLSEYGQKLRAKTLRELEEMKRTLG